MNKAEVYVGIDESLHRLQDADFQSGETITEIGYLLEQILSTGEKDDEFISDHLMRNVHILMRRLAGATIHHKYSEKQIELVTSALNSAYFLYHYRADGCSFEFKTFIIYSELLQEIAFAYPLFAEKLAKL